MPVTSTELNIDDILQACNLDAEGLKQSVDFLKGMGELLPTPNKNDGQFFDQQSTSNNVTNVS